MTNAQSDNAPKCDCPDELATKGFSLRPETEADLPSLRAIYRQLRAPEFALLPLNEQQKAVLIDSQFDIQHRQYAAYPGADLLVLDSPAGLAGRLYLAREETGLHVVEITIQANLRGQGIGGALLAAVQETAKANGVGVTLHVEKTNPALALYLRLGFRVTDDTGFSLSMAWLSRD